MNVRRAFYLVLLLWLACIVIVTLAGCAGFQGGGRPFARVGLGSPARHNVEILAGGGYEWAGGASTEITYRPWLRVEDPSSRGFPQEVGRVFAEAKIPLGR